MSLVHRYFSNILLVKTNYLVYPSAENWSKMGWPKYHGIIPLYIIEAKFNATFFATNLLQEQTWRTLPACKCQVSFMFAHFKICTSLKKSHFRHLWFSGKPKRTITSGKLFYLLKHCKSLFKLRSYICHKIQDYEKISKTFRNRNMGGNPSLISSLNVYG